VCPAGMRPPYESDRQSFAGRDSTAEDPRLPQVDIMSLIGVQREGVRGGVEATVGAVGFTVTCHVRCHEVGSRAAPELSTPEPNVPVSSRPWRSALSILAALVGAADSCVADEAAAPRARR
jgi:hypothetical protein